MALTLVHQEFIALLATATDIDSYPVYIPEDRPLPAMAYRLDSIARDIESNLRGTTVTAHVYNVTIAAKKFKALQAEVQKVIDTLDQYTGGKFLLTLVEDASDEYDPDFEVFMTTIQISIRTREA